MSLPIIFSIIFFMVSVIYYYFGAHIHVINFRSKTNHVFGLCCLCLSVWSFSFSISNSAPDYETSQFWRRMASLGWCSFFSLTLHLSLIITEKQQLLKKAWIYVAIYLPALFFTFVYTIYSPVANGRYVMKMTKSGWENVVPYIGIDWAFDFYYLSFSILSLIILVSWAFSSQNGSKKIQAIMVGTAYACSLITASAIEFFLKPKIGITAFQMAPVIIMIPITVLYSCLKNYGLISPDFGNRIAKRGHILSEATKLQLYYLLARVYIFAAFFSFMVRYFCGKEEFGSALLFSLMLVFLGMTLMIVQHMRIKDADNVSDFIMTITIPIIIFKYLQRAPIYAWIIPVIFILVAVAFNQRRMLIFTGISTLISLLLVWYEIPVSTVTFGNIDHLVRIIVMALVFALAFYINHIYVMRLEENEEQVQLQKILSQISTLFITANDKNIGSKLKEAVNMCGQHFKTDRIYVLLLDAEGDGINTTYEWCNLKVEPKREQLKHLKNEDLPHFLQFSKLIFMEGMNRIDADTYPEGSDEKIWLKQKNITSLMVFPLRNKDTSIGILALETVKKPLRIRKEQIETLKVLAHLISDIWIKIITEKEIQYRAYYDTLTGLPNRTLLTNRMEQALNLAKRTQKLVGVLFVDLDSFKVINDTIGHKGGDAILVQIGKRLCKSVRQYDTVAHFGGDEFLIMVPQIATVEDILKVAEKIIDNIKKPMVYQEQEYFLTASVGISVYPFDGESTDEMIKNADLAMFFSKENGKNKCTLCSEGMKKDAWMNMELTNNLYRALEREEFVLYYQPQVDAITGEIIGTEALIRWNHPQKGLISPGVFIPLAEKTGLINNIGQWVLMEACTQNKKWQEQGLKPITMAVNLSLGQFLNPKLVKTVKNILEITQVDPSYLELEITESIACYDPEYITETMNRLKKLGVSISIDDFGTEYSSLSRLKTMPIDKIKIDMKFVHGITTGSKDEGIIKVILQMGRTFGLTVIAEGVENKEQLEFLQENQCDEIQGYYFYKPLPAENIESILRENMAAKDNDHDEHNENGTI